MLLKLMEEYSVEQHKHIESYNLLLCVVKTTITIILKNIKVTLVLFK